MLYMSTNAKLISVCITSSISHACLQEVVGMAENNKAANYNDVGFFRSAIYFLKQMQRIITVG